MLQVLFAGCAVVQGAVYLGVFFRVVFYKDRELAPAHGASSAAGSGAGYAPPTGSAASSSPGLAAGSGVGYAPPTGSAASSSPGLAAGSVVGETRSAAPFARVSVLVCARNEAPNLRNNLPSLLAQDYPDWELLLVNDGSSDGSAAWLDEQASRHPRLRVLHVSAAEKAGPGKKGALALGIARASGPILLLSDADCRPSGAQWIRHMAAPFNDPQRGPGTDFVLGYGAYSPEKGWLNRLVQFETLHTLVQYAGWTLAGMPYMGVGRNLAYRKAVYEQGRGFAAHQHWPSGDDDLFVNANARKGRVALCLHPEAWTESRSPASWKAWVTQKTRHLSTGVFYRPLHRVVLSFYAMSHFGLYATLFGLIAVSGPILWILGVFLLRLLLVNGLFWHLGRRFRRPLLWHFSTIFDFWTVAYYARFVSSTLSPKPPLWR
jgi:cellulose synthase/poly-beta-1,6-N-acetylglucosamine synthase-like glycosyltransferase